MIKSGKQSHGWFPTRTFPWTKRALSSRGFHVIGCTDHRCFCPFSYSLWCEKRFLYLSGWGGGIESETLEMCLRVEAVASGPSKQCLWSPKKVGSTCPNEPDAVTVALEKVPSFMQLIDKIIADRSQAKSYAVEMAVSDTYGTEYLNWKKYLSI